MTRRIATVLVVLGLGMGLAGCTSETPTVMLQSTVESAVEETQPASVSPTQVPPTEVPSPEPSPTAVQTAATATPEGKGPELLAPPDGLAARLFDLTWQWEPGLKENEWYELQVWPDTPNAEPSAFTWLKETTRRITAAHLLPGTYRWRVVVVEGYGDARGDETSPYSEERTFTLLRPSTVSTKPLVTPAATTYR